MDAAPGLWQALDAWTDLVARPVVGDRWVEPSVLDGFTVGGLVNHVSQGIAWTAALLGGAPPGDEVPAERGDYYAAMKRGVANEVAEGHDAVVAMAEAAAAKHGHQATVERLGSVADALREADLTTDRLIDPRPLIPFVVRLDDFLATRVVELTVHGDDLAVSIDLDGLEPGPMAAAVAHRLLLDTAVSQHGGLAVLRALARRERTSGEVFPVL